MTDIFTRAERSRIMRLVKHCGNKSTELKLIHIFSTKRVTGWRRGYPLCGKPDFVFPKKRIAIFVDGCFWHGHDCRNTIPKDNAEFWQAKFKRTRKRDRTVTETLSEKGWNVIRIWECQLKTNNLPPELSLLEGLEHEEMAICESRTVSHKEQKSRRLDS